MPFYTFYYSLVICNFKIILGCSTSKRKFSIDRTVLVCLPCIKASRKDRTHRRLLRYFAHGFIWMNDDKSILLTTSNFWIKRRLHVGTREAPTHSVYHSHPFYHNASRTVSKLCTTCTQSFSLACSTCLGRLRGSGLKIDVWMRGSVRNWLRWQPTSLSDSAIGKQIVRFFFIFLYKIVFKY